MEKWNFEYENMNTSPEYEKMIIGWREWVSLPELNIPAIKAKIDTGARTSALHAFDTEVFETDGQQKIRFGVRPMQKKKEIVLYCVADFQEQRMVTDSGGHRELRYVIRTPVSLGDRVWSIEITLTRRDTLKFRMLVGRSALRMQLLIDPEKSYLMGRSLAKQYSKTQGERRIK